MIGILRTFCAQFRSFSHGIYRLPPSFLKNHPSHYRSPLAPIDCMCVVAWPQMPRFAAFKGLLQGKKKMLVKTRVFVQSFSHQGGKQICEIL